MQPGWCQPVRQEFMENECEALPGVAYPGVWDKRSTINTKTGYDDDDDVCNCYAVRCCVHVFAPWHCLFIAVTRHVCVMSSYYHVSKHCCVVCITGCG